MSEYEKKNNRGAAFNNNAKEKPSQPDMIGAALVDGKEKRFAFWKNKASDGSEYITFIISDPLSEEDKKNYRKADLPAQAPYKKNDNNIQTKEVNSTNIKNENNDMKDLQEILNLGDDDTPF